MEEKDKVFKFYKKVKICSKKVKNKDFLSKVIKTTKTSEELCIPAR